MTIRHFRGDAPAVAQVDVLTVGGTVEMGDEFHMTVNGKTITVVAAAADADAVRDDLVAAWNLSTIPEFAEVTAEAAATTGALTLTADVPGRPFLVSVSTTEAGGGPADSQTFDRAALVASSGPQHWDAAANWSGGAVPANGDEVIIDGGNVDLSYGLEQSSVTLAALIITQGYTGRIGLPDVHTSGSTRYFEYRPRSLAIGAAAVRIGGGSGSGSGRIRLDTGATATVLSIFGTGQAAENGQPAIRWIGAHAANEVQITRGTLGIALGADETAELALLRAGYQTNAAGDVQVRCGSGTVIAAVEQSGGTVALPADSSQVVLTGGELQLEDGAHASLLIDGGRCYYRSPGTLGDVQVGGGGAIDFSRDMRSRTVTNCQLSARAALLDPFGTVTFTNPIVLHRSGLADVDLDLGRHLTLQRGDA